MLMKKAHPGWGWFCIAIGIFLLLAALGVIEPTNQEPASPPLILALCGLVFVVGGCMVLVGRKSRLNSLGAAIVCLSFSFLGLWVALFSPPEAIAGGIPFLPQSINAVLGKWLFGAGSVISLAVSIYALREYLNWGK